METNHYIQGPEEILIKLGTETKVNLQKDFNNVFDKYSIKLKEKGLEELVFKTEKKKVLIYGLKTVD